MFELQEKKKLTTIDIIDVIKLGYCISFLGLFEPCGT